MTQTNKNQPPEEEKDVNNERPATPGKSSVKRSDIPKIDEQDIRVSPETTRYLIKNLQLD
ncbi:MAG: hypothetical protein SXA11_00385 [Cyanobacteriota bacterium]|nr:hypothetical protein [Cyanobacteriota bacterium]